MISNTFLTNTFIEGMDCDTDITMLDNKRYRYAENIRIITNDEGTTGVLQGIEGVRKYVSSLISSDETVIGVTTVDKYGIVITTKNNGYNKVYRIDNFNTAVLSPRIVLKGNIGLCKDLTETPNISLVANYESDDVIKIYFTDGKSSVKVFNIMDDRYRDLSSGLVDNSGDIINPLVLDITPGCILPPLNMSNMGIGSLPAGMVLYCYQLFNLQGTETTTSPLSEIIHLTSSSTNLDSLKYEGSSLNTSSNKSISLDVDLITKDFERCRIIRILYLSNNDVPIFTIVDEIEVLPDLDKITYTDTGNSYMADITVDEFNSLTGYLFIGCSLAKMQNRLFVANITEDTWNPGDYDARAYRSNASGTVVLLSADSSDNLSFNIDSLTSSTVPTLHDCINPYNSLEYSNCSSDQLYVYGISNGSSRLLGGHGINVDYTFITTTIRLVESSLESSTLISNDCSMNINAQYMTTISRLEVGNNTLELVLLNDSAVANRIPNYADPYIASHFKGYQRDEIYRFGIIFYNNKSIPSPVYWIGDIKMPHASQVPPFEYRNGVLYGNALGIKFVVRNIPDGAVSYEIVRCDRTENDRHVVMQAITSNLYEYKISENGEAVGEGNELDASIEMRPTPFFTNILGSFDTSIDWFGQEEGESTRKRRIYYEDRVAGYIRAVSPEICVQKTDVELYLKDSAYIDFVGVYLSPIEAGSNKAIMASASETTNNDGNVVTWDKISTVSRGSDDILNIFMMNKEDLYHDNVNVGFSGMISKYFYPLYGEISSDGDSIPILDAIYATDIPYNGVEDVSPYRNNIGEKAYTNWAVSNFREAGALNIMGPAGPSLILEADNYHNILHGFTSTPEGIDQSAVLNAVPVINIKRNVISAYGGNTYVSRLNSVYIPTNSYVRIQGSASYTTYTYGGDTYLGMLDYPNTFIFLRNDATQWNWCKAFIGSYIPFETSINTNLFSGDMVHRTYTSDNYVDVNLLLEPQQTLLYHSLDEPYFAYNTVYSSLQGSKLFVPKSIYAKDNVHTSNRIMVSQAKVSNEILDNWTVFRAADYLDVDNLYRGITNLKVFKDRLFYFLDTAVGIASVNERSLITDDNNNELVLGTGGILTRFDYITILNGSSIINDRSITNSDNVLYWYDYDKNEICAYNGAVNIISKEKSVLSYLNEMYTEKRNCNLAFYDKKYNETWFKFYDKSLIFNELIGRFTSFYTFNPDWALLFSDKVVTIKDNGYYVINTLDVDGLGEIDKTSKLEIIINKDVMYTKTFDNILIEGQMKGTNNENLTKGMISLIIFNTKHQTATSDNPTFDYRENSYRLPIPRQDESEQDVSMSFPARMRGKVMVCDYKFDNNNERLFKIPFIATTYRYSLI